jgi:hypothetical protein
MLAVKSNSNPTFVQNFTYKDISFEFLNLGPKAMLYSLKNSPTFVLGISSFGL